ncbi:alpha/beta hydrolase [Mesobacillus subterraneus]|uniref:Alpha/beta hydrolase n=1 Tax=Mesobacillus subterraneus TaxID=285983 RepID=A0A3R9FDE9_9BACI|nr:alpha/beta hydrolase [Mesobacillus subterraneus]RSD25510.1 alpha/beta hydrolase [Mesobacillus subterraneus]
MFKIIKKSVDGYLDLPVNYQMFKQEKQSRGLAVMMPGRGYTVQGPLFHYSTGIYLNKGYDVLHINYDYTTEQSESLSLDEQIKQISVDVNTVLNQVLTDSQYTDYALIGKSLGTIALASLADRQEFYDAKYIWLTPLLQLDLVFEKMLSSNQKGLCIIGDQDSCFIQEKYEKLTSKKTMSSMLVPGTEHSLNYADDPVGSIDVLKKVMTEINDF